MQIPRKLSSLHPLQTSPAASSPTLTSLENSRRQGGCIPHMKLCTISDCSYLCFQIQHHFLHTTEAAAYPGKTGRVPRDGLEAPFQQPSCFGGNHSSCGFQHANACRGGDSGTSRAPRGSSNEQTPGQEGKVVKEPQNNHCNCSNALSTHPWLQPCRDMLTPMQGLDVACPSHPSVADLQPDLTSQPLGQAGSS